MCSNDTMRRERFLRLWHAHYGHVLAYGLRRAPEGASDLAAEVFAIAWRRIDDVPSHDPLPWPYACARRVLLNERRGRRRRAALVERLSLEAPVAPIERQDHTLLEALARLSEPDREALLLAAWEGLDGRAAAEVLGCSRAAYKVRLHRARARLREQLGGDRRARAAARPQEDA